MKNTEPVKVTPLNSFASNKSTEFFAKNNTKSINYFIGKPCTIICKNSSLIFKDTEQYYRHFFGIIEFIDDNGIMINAGETKSYFFKNNIIGIIEEKIKTKEEIKLDIKTEAPQPINWDTISKLGK